MIVNESCWQCVCVGPRTGSDEEWAVWLGWFDPEGEAVPVELILHTPVEQECISLGKVTGKKLSRPVYRMDTDGKAKMIQSPSLASGSAMATYRRATS